MAFNINQFRSQMLYDGARPNLFECTLTFPTGVSVPDGAGRKLTFMARAAQLPGSTVNQISQFYFGRELKFSGNRTFPEWTITIINDEDFIVRKAFEIWLNGLNSHAGNLRNANFENPRSYQRPATVTQFGKTGDPIKAYRFVGMFPIDISPIELDWGANDAIEEYAVTLAYQWWESDTTDSASSNTATTGTTVVARID
jgi:hypothetical protein